MKPVTTAHHTVVVKRTLDASAPRVFDAWRDSEALKKWYVPGEGTWQSKILRHEFRVGGGGLMTFGAPGDAQYTQDYRYEDIVDDQRICYAMTIVRDAVRITTSMVTIEFAAAGQRTALTITDQMVILDGGDTAADRERGWGETLDKLPPLFRRQTGRDPS
ncbi:MAG: polyketide cyclase [Alphaproteobacteria bacterium]|nr:polyketide cyclase [Alphaproteobacteria bacterium]